MKQSSKTYVLVSTGYPCNSFANPSAATKKRKNSLLVTDQRVERPCKVSDEPVGILGVIHQMACICMLNIYTVYIYQRNKPSHCSFMATYTLTGIKRITPTSIHVRLESLAVARISIPVSSTRIWLWDWAIRRYNTFPLARFITK